MSDPIDIQSRSEQFFADYLTAQGISGVHPATSADDLEYPFVVVQAHDGEERPPFSLNFDMQISFQVTSDADEGLAAHRTLVGNVFNALSSGTLAQAVTATGTNFECVGAYSLSFGRAEQDSEFRSWTTVAGLRAYCRNRTSA